MDHRLSEAGLTVLAGVLGAFVARLQLKDRSPLAIASAMICGGAASYFLAPWIANALALGEGGVGAAGFLLGMTCMHAGPWLIQAARDPLGTLARFLEIWRGGVKQKPVAPVNIDGEK